MNQKKRIALTTTFVGLVCGFVLTQQQAAAAATNAPDSTATSMVAPENTAAATSAEPSQNNQPVDQQTNSQKAVTNENSTSETTTQIQNPGSQSTGSMTTPTAAQPNNTNSSATPAPSQKTAAAPNTETISSVNSTNDDNQSVNKVTASKTTNTAESPTSPNNNSTTTASQDPQVETLAQGTWGSSKWEYVHQGDDYILHFHAGTLGASSQDNSYNFLGSIGVSPEVFNGNGQWIDALTQIIIDPGVKANQDSSYLFAGLYHLQKIVGLDNLDTVNVTNMSGMFLGCYKLTSLDVSHFNTANVTDMSDMFVDCTSLTSLDVSNFNTANVTNMSWMFTNCENLTSLDVSHFNTANVTDMSGMFSYRLGIKNLDLSHFNTSNVTDMSYMFVKNVILESLNISNFDTTNVTNMSCMFLGCSKLNSLDLSKFNTDNVTDMSYMFYGCNNITSLDLNNFNTAKVTDMHEMFYVCSGLTSLDLSHFNTAKVTDMHVMFDGCFNLNHLILGPDTLLNTSAWLPDIPQTGTQIPGTAKRVTSPYWVATSGYQQGHKYTSNELMGLTGRDQVTTYDWDSTPAFTQTTETKAVTRAIRIHQPDGYLKTELQTVMVHRSVTINPDGSKTYGAWSTAQWDAYQIPEIAGYQANNSSIAAQAVNGETVDQTIDIYYQPQLQTVEIQYLDQGQIVGKQTITGYTGQTIVPNYQVPEGYEITTATPATITIDGSGKQIIQVNVSHKQEESMEYKTITRTVNLHQTNGQIKTYNQVALLQRSVQIDAVTGNKTYGHWNTGYWDAINIPTVAGYTASQDQVADQLVTDQDTNQTVDVYYTPTPH